MNKKLTISIGIPAHNEENNIAKLLATINNQASQNYTIDSIFVACDGCTDNTVKIVKQIARVNKKIIIINDGKRLGQSGRLNQFFKLNKSDVFITFDADTLLGTKHVLDEMTKLYFNNKVGIVAGCDTPAKPQNWVQKMAKTWIDVWFETRRNYNNGINVNNNKGCCTSLRGSIAKGIVIPKELALGNDDFLYFFVKKIGYEFRFAQKAIVYYSVPSNLNDFFSQTTRFLSAKHKIAKHFGNWVYDEYLIPRAYKLKALRIVFSREPLFLTLAVFFQLIQRILKPLYKEKYTSGLWNVARSTK